MKKIFCFLALFAVSYTNVSAISLEDYIAKFTSDSTVISQKIIDSGRKYKIDPLLLAALAETESHFSKTAISSAGAIGITQLMPGTAEGLGVNPYNIEENIDGGAKYLREMLDIHKDKGVYQYNYALASYNAGPGNVSNRIPSYTYDYIQTIQDTYYRLKQEITPDKKSNPISAKQALLQKLKELKKKQ